MKPNFGAVIAGAIALLMILSASMFVVDQRQNAIVFRLGEVVSIKKDPGLYFKVPMLDRILAAVASQVAPSAHAYTHGESERLVRPVLFVLQRGLHDQAEWSAWVAGVASPAPMASWSQAFASEAGLARRHNLRMFLFALHAMLRESEVAALRERAPPVLTALQAGS